jgi:hypothetical protein
MTVPFLTSATDGRERPVSHSGRFTTKKEPPVRLRWEVPFDSRAVLDDMEQKPGRAVRSLSLYQAGNAAVEECTTKPE